jgi:hypothetical protein
MPHTVSLISSGSAADTEHPLDDRVEPGISIFIYYIVCVVPDCFSFDVKVFVTRPIFETLFTSVLPYLLFILHCFFRRFKR